jgi:ubiquinone/menaquinone biosynthesis C-methylase UbiE
VSKAYFQEIASDWDDMQQSFFSKNIREKAFNIAGIKAGKTAADIGAGTGYLTQGLLSNGLNVIAIDQSENMLNELKQKFSMKKIQNISLTCIVGEAENLPLEQNSVDYAFANMYLHHVEHPLTAIREMARIVKPGGKVVITDMDCHDFEFLENEHFDRWKGFEKNEIESWFRKVGLKNVQVLPTEEICSSES